MAGEHFLNLQPGTIVNGCYEVVKSLGTGSMGTVYACRHRELTGHIVAMKVLSPDVARDEVIATRFRNEIVASYRVSHPNVVRAYEYFRDGDLIAFTMEYIPGGDLADRIGSSERIPISEILHMLLQISAGVQAIHEAGIIHRDLKPENILISAQGEVKITDFGIARAGTGPRLTEHGGVVGTIEYVAPEYLEVGEVDARSDIYALGVIAYEMITKQSPFKGKSPIETMTMRLRTDPEPPHNLRADCPVELSRVVLKAMARDQLQRYSTAKEMYEDLEKVPKVAAPRVLGQAAAREAAAKPSELSASGAKSGLGFMDSPKPATNLPALRNFEDYPEPVVPMESVLAVERGVTSTQLQVSAAGTATVSVSSSKLPAARVKALAVKAKPKQAKLSSLASFFSAGLIVLLGFAVGVLMLKHFKPDLFELPAGGSGVGQAGENGLE